MQLWGTSFTDRPYSIRVNNLDSEPHLSASLISGNPYPLVSNQKGMGHPLVPKMTLIPYLYAKSNSRKDCVTGWFHSPVHRITAFIRTHQSNDKLPHLPLISKHITVFPTDHCKKDTELRIHFNRIAIGEQKLCSSFFLAREHNRNLLGGNRQHG